VPDDDGYSVYTITLQRRTEERVRLLVFTASMSASIMTALWW
jgi:hypothetical protein